MTLSCIFIFYFFIFILVTKTLSKILLKEEAQGQLEGIQISRNSPSITHLLFAKAIYINAKSISKSLTKYQEWWGQKVNMGKSSIFITMNTSQEVKQAITQILPSNSQRQK